MTNCLGDTFLRNSIISISEDISNFFDRNATEFIASGMMAKSEEFYAEIFNDYHWLFCSASGITLNYELVYDVILKKWFRIDRGSGKYLQCGFQARDTYGQSYPYGTIDTGYLERLEYSNTMDGTAYDSTWQCGNIPLGGWMRRSKIRNMKHIAKSKSTNVNPIVTITHYGDCVSTSGESTVSPNLVSATASIAVKNESVDWGNNLFHSIKCVWNSSDANDTIGYQPIGVGLRVDIIRDDLL